MTDQKVEAENAVVPHFDIDASIVFQLGESLIRDPLQALLELIKNSYDAGANKVSVTIDTGRAPEDSPFPKAKGFIEVGDTGIGMDRADLIRGWLTISGSPKRQIKKGSPAGSELPMGRYPLGDKGLGRLGVQRLGNNVEIYTRPIRDGKESKLEYNLAFSWDQFRKVERLSEVQVPIGERPAVRELGTSIRVSDLYDTKVWEDSKLLGSLQARLAHLVSPFVPVPEFEIELVLNGKDVDVISVTNDILKAAMVEYEFEFGSGVLRMSGQARMPFPRPESDAALYTEHVESDGGDAFLDFLAGSREYRLYNIRRSSRKGWFVEFDLAKPLGEFDGVELRGKTVADPGAFAGKIHYFDFKKASDRPGTFKTPADFSSYVRQLSGVHVYRDGFGVRTAQDWLGLAEAFTSGSSYYGLRPSNTLGYVAITSRGNAALEETTDREGFKDTPEYRNFYALLRRVIEFSAGVQEFLRRGWIGFRDARARPVNAPPNHHTPESRVEELNRQIAAAAPSLNSMRLLSDTIRRDLQQPGSASESDTAPVIGIKTDPDTTRHAVEQSEARQQEVRASVARIQDLLQHTESVLGSVERLQQYAELLQKDIVDMRGQLEQVYEMVGLGLTAEALSHELGNVLTQLSQRTRDTRSYLKRAKSADTKLVLFVEYVHESIKALRKQLAHIAPSLRYVREQRSVFSMVEAASELEEYYTSIFRSRSDPIAITVRQVRDFSIRMNRGKLTQIVDNLVINSEYWLLEDLRVGNLTSAEIVIEIEEPWLRVYDNGRGVSTELEDAVFEPFVTGKASGTGRGLGLFIVKQLLESEGCGISLAPERNNRGRRYIFQIDLNGALHV